MELLMPVQSHHDDYETRRPDWEDCRTVFAGERAVKLAGRRYLPQLSARQNFSDYEAYKGRALFFNAVARTIQGLVGAVFRKDPAVEFTDEDQLADVTLTGVPFAAFARGVLQEVLTVGRYGVLLDMATSNGRRPYLAGYRAEDIINWNTARRGGDEILTRVVLSETVSEPDPDDSFVAKPVEQLRVLELDNDQRYSVTIWRRVRGWIKGRFGSEAPFQIVEEFFPMRLGQRLDFIPFCFFGPSGITPDVEKPPLLDLVDVNLSHYRSSADLEHGRHWTGLPTLFFAGLDEKHEIAIGSAQAIVASDSNAKGQFIEFSGQGLRALEMALQEKQRLMAVLGARLLEDQKRDAETAEAMRIRQSGDSATLRSITTAVSQGLTLLLTWWQWWGSGSTATVNVSLNEDFMDKSLTPGELQALLAAWQSGGISWQTLFWNLTRSQAARPGISAEQEKHEIETETPTEEI
jgi:hypothetical protein